MGIKLVPLSRSTQKQSGNKAGPFVKECIQKQSGNKTGLFVKECIQKQSGNKAGHFIKEYTGIDWESSWSLFQEKYINILRIELVCSVKKYIDMDRKLSWCLLCQGVDSKIGNRAGLLYQGVERHGQVIKLICFVKEQIEIDWESSLSALSRNRLIWRVKLVVPFIQGGNIDGYGVNRNGLKIKLDLHNKS